MTTTQLSRMLHRRLRRTDPRSPERFAVYVALDHLKKFQNVPYVLFKMHFSALWSKHRYPNSGEAEAITVLIGDIERIHVHKGRRNP